jgi:hypothetical protein
MPTSGLGGLAGRTALWLAFPALLWASGHQLQMVWLKQNRRHSTLQIQAFVLLTIKFIAFLAFAALGN